MIADLANEDVCYQVELEYQEMASSFERVKKRWLKLDPGQQARTPLMDINMTDIEGYSIHTCFSRNWADKSFLGDLLIISESQPQTMSTMGGFRTPSTVL